MIEGTRVIDGSDNRGALREGWAADMTIIDLDGLTQDLVYEPTDASGLLLARMTGGLVTGLVVAGEPVLAERRLLRIDFDAALQELRTQSTADAGSLADRHRMASRMREAIRAYYAAGAHVNG